MTPDETDIWKFEGAFALRQSFFGNPKNLGVTSI